MRKDDSLTTDKAVDTWKEGLDAKEKCGMDVRHQRKLILGKPKFRLKMKTFGSHQSPQNFFMALSFLYFISYIQSFNKISKTIMSLPRPLVDSILMTRRAEIFLLGE